MLINVSPILQPRPKGIPPLNSYVFGHEGRESYTRARHSKRRAFVGSDRAAFFAASRVRMVSDVEVMVVVQMVVK